MMDELVLCPKANDLVNKLFMVFYAICRGFDRQYGDNTQRLSLEKGQWVEAFMEMGITEYKQIEIGIKKCRLDPNLINTPTIGMFLSWCKPSSDDLGLMPKEQAYNRAYDIMRDGDCGDMSEDQHNILLHAIRESDRHFLKTNTIDKTQPVFYRNYEIAVRDFLAGKMKPIPKAIEHSEKHEDLLKNLQYYGGILPQYAHLKTYEEAWPIITQLIGKIKRVT